MSCVYLLHHVHEYEDGREDVKLIGVYTSETLASEALARVRNQPGFRDHPAGFEICEYELNQDSWTEGYVTLVPIEIPIVGGDDRWCTVHASVRADGTYEICTPNDDPEQEPWRYLTGEVVVCEERRFVDGTLRLMAIGRATERDDL